ncbi:MAG TPA: hypothetical protein DHV62_04100 [Elusimicrobia bacterium]|jgi:DNA repair protein RadC|nr:hypothetical protein [Elusimicrobiota bacterium]
MKLKELHKIERPREKLEKKGASALHNEELLAIILRTGYKGKNVLEVAKEILKKYPLDKLETFSFGKLKEIKGIGPSRAASLIAGFELSKRIFNKGEQALPKIEKPEDAIAQATYLLGKKKEYFIALYLNARNQLVHRETVSIGTLSASLVHPREVFQPAIAHSAAGIILIHNHPSGDTKPSEDDLELTKRLIQTGEILGIEILDHLILSETNFLSFKQTNLL